MRDLPDPMHPTYWCIRAERAEARLADADKPWVQMLRRWESADLREALPG